MKLRIVSGSLRGRTINFPDAKVPFRPTLERTRQSIADMLQPVIAGSVAADLCAGSGSFGFELISRGASSVDFVENDRAGANLIRRHAEKFGVAGQCRVLVSDVAEFANSCTRQYDIIFFDPPYDREGMVDLVSTLMRRLSPGGRLLYQRRRRTLNKGGSDADRRAPDEIKTFGDTAVECYRCPEDFVGAKRKEPA